MALILGVVLASCLIIRGQVICLDYSDDQDDDSGLTIVIPPAPLRGHHDDREPALPKGHTRGLIFQDVPSPADDGPETKGD